MLSQGLIIYITSFIKAIFTKLFDMVSGWVDIAVALPRLSLTVAAHRFTTLTALKHFHTERVEKSLAISTTVRSLNLSKNISLKNHNMQAKLTKSNSKVLTQNLEQIYKYIISDETEQLLHGGSNNALYGLDRSVLYSRWGKQYTNYMCGYWVVLQNYDIFNNRPTLV